jgi:beta-lactam-binding protein with PASTA domain
MQHLEDYAAPIRSLRPETPLAVENLLKKSLAKDLNVRYASTSAMLRDFNKILSAPEMQEAEETATVDNPTQAWRPFVAAEALPEKASWWVFPVVFGSSFLLVALLGMLLFSLFSPPRGEVTVPNLIGMELGDAREILKQNHLELRIIKQIFSSKHTMNHVVSQKPLSGQVKRAGSVIEIVLSKGPELVRVPDLFGKTQQEAELILGEIGLKLGGILTEIDDSQPQGIVIKQSPEADTLIERDASVSITVNSPSGLVQVPNFIGHPLADVQAELNSLGFSFNKATSTSNSIYPAGTIVDQRPSPNERVPKGTALTFIVSSGPPST